MKRIILTIALILPVCICALGQKPGKANLKRTEAVQTLIDRVDQVYHLSIHLSNHIAVQKSGQPISTSTRTHIGADLKDLDSLIKSFPQDTQKISRYFISKEKIAIAEQSENLYLRDSLMNVILLELTKDKIPVYAAQIDYTSNAINSFIAATSDFKQYLQTLVPVIPDTLYQKINTIISLVQPKTDGNQYLAVSAFQHNIFGLSYLHRIGKISSAKTISYLGAEVIGPLGSSTINTSQTIQNIEVDSAQNRTIRTTTSNTRSTYAKNPGGYILYGLRDSKLLMEVGVGYFKTSVNDQDVSWKCGLLYTPQSFGIGLSYSPLTSIGVQITYKW